MPGYETRKFNRNIDQFLVKTESFQKIIAFSIPEHHRMHTKNIKAINWIDF